MPKPILCLDFDGVLHSYTSGWKGPEIVADPPVPGAFEFLTEAVKHFEVHIYSSRSSHALGRLAMQDWVAEHLARGGHDPALLAQLHWPNFKPSAMLTIDDRAITFTGKWPNPASLLDFKPWNKR